MVLKPPASPGLELSTSIFQPRPAAKRSYMLYRSPAKIAASSPPTPARISTMVFLSSLGSAGISRYLISSSRPGIFSSLAEMSSCSISFSSASASRSISFAASMSSSACRYSFAFATSSAWFACSFATRAYSLGSLTTEGSIIFFSSSAYAAMSLSSLSLISLSFRMPRRVRGGAAEVFSLLRIPPRRDLYSRRSAVHSPSTMRARADPALRRGRAPCHRRARPTPRARRRKL